MEQNFVNLHVHTAVGSLLDSIAKVPDIVKFAVDNNQPAIAITDHGYMSGFVDFVKECKAYGIKPIIGEEAYEVDNALEKADTKDYKQPRYHLILLAKNKEGLENLFKISSWAATDGFYKKPLIEVQRIKENGWGKGIIACSACMIGRISRMLELGKKYEAKAFYDLCNETFDDFYLEIQSHPNEYQMQLNNNILDFANEVNTDKIIITTDAHMINKNQLDVHSVFVKIGTEREVGVNYEGCYLQTYQDVIDTCSQFNIKMDLVQKAIDNTLKIADMVEDIDIGLHQENQMPIIDIPTEFENGDEYVEYLIWKGFDEKFKDLPEDKKEKRRQRILEELPVIKALHYSEYFIMLQMLTNAAKAKGIPLGYSRGSGANCLCLFCLGVTQIDSVRWKLDFSRFANLGRKSMADYDMDISKERRREFVEISEDLFGRENVAPICTYNTLSTKVAIRDIGKVLDEDPESPYYKKIPYNLRDEVAKMIPTVKTIDDLGEETEKEETLQNVLSVNPKMTRVYQQFPKWFYYVLQLEGLPKSRGRHAAGTIIAPRPVTEYAPLCQDKDGNKMLQLEMHAAMDDLSLIKMDFLGLKTLDIIDDALKIAGLTWDDVDINNLNLDDEEVYDNIYKIGHTVGVFQMESLEARKMCIQAQANDVEDVIAINAANRPRYKRWFPRILC
ncbi:MAG: DNA polymerase III subunit alpha [Clostridia bacterium]